MVTRALHDSGLHLVGSGAEDFIDTADDNPEGFWENKAIVACNDALLEATGGAWDNPPELAPQAGDDPRVGQVAEASTTALAALGEREPWGFKDPRTCLTAAYWRDLEPDLRFVICVRNPLEVALSLKRRNQNSYSLGLSLWEQYYVSVLDQVPEDRRIVTHFDRFFVDPEGETARLCAFAGLDAASPRVRADLRHHTIGVGLVEAGTSDALRALYHELCREAGVGLPVEAQTEPGRVRRLILDGAVATRHAEQRQAAIDRLQERERELRAEQATTEAQHRTRVRDLEAQLVKARIDATARADAMRALTESAARTERVVGEIDARTRATESRLEVAIRAVEVGPVHRRIRRFASRARRGVHRFLFRPSRRAIAEGQRHAAPVARAAGRKLPEPTQQAMRRTRRVVKRGIANPVPTAKAAGRKLTPTARRATAKLPPSAQDTLRRNRTRLVRAQQAPSATARRAARRLPPQAQDLLRRARILARRLQADGAVRVRVAADTPKPTPAPKGPALRQWKDSYHHMVRTAVPRDTRCLVCMPGSPREVRDIDGPRPTAFPDNRKGRPLADDLSHVAHLEALRCDGHQYLILPEGSRPWFDRQHELRDHVVGTYRTIVDEANAGAVFDLTAAPEAGPRSLRGEINQLSDGQTAAAVPAVLNWTDLDLVSELSELATFQPPVGSQLPYLDASIDVVVIDEMRDLGEARRVASLGVITVASRASGHVVTKVEATSKAPPPKPPRVLIWSSPADDSWRDQITARADEAGSEVLLARIGSSIISEMSTDDFDVIVAVEPHVLPLPGAIQAAARLARAAPDTAIAAKILQADGALEAAGGTVFSDRSVGLIANASTDVRAPWHEFTRPVCWAPGLLAASSSLWARVGGPDTLFGRDYLREWCARVWEHSGAVIYHPDVTAVRVSGNGGEASVPLDSSAWQRVLDLRPPRPDALRDGEWRYLLAHDDVAACRG